MKPFIIKNKETDKQVVIIGRVDSNHFFGYTKKTRELTFIRDAQTGDDEDQQTISTKAYLFVRFCKENEFTGGKQQ